jgi:pyridoxine 4-dehydrogenase
MKRSLELGANCWNGGLFYGTPDHNSLHLLHKYFSKYPEDAEKVFVSIKLGLSSSYVHDCSPAALDADIAKCLSILDGTKKMDLVQCGRVDPNVPIEISVGAIAKHVASGEIGGVSLSEVSAASIRRAAAVTTISAVEVEFSLFATDIKTNGVAAACAELGIVVMAYSPLGRGFLTGSYKTRADLPERVQRFPRFSEENFPKNLELAKGVEEIAKEKGCAVSQLALAWVCAQSGKNGMPTIIPIPGTTTVQRLAENMKAVTLSEAEMERIDKLLESISVVGGRYPEMFAHLEYA